MGAGLGAWLFLSAVTVLLVNDQEATGKTQATWML